MKFFKKRKKKFEEIDQEEIFLDEYFKKKYHLVEKPIENSRLFFFGGAIFFSFLFLIFFCFKIQFLDSSLYKALARENQFILEKVKLERGIIYDRNFNQLSFNKNIFSLFCKKELINFPNKIKSLSAILSETPSLIKKILEKNKKEKIFLIKKELSHKELIVLESRKDEFPECEIKKEIKRFYLKDYSLSHILGYLGKPSKEDLRKFEGIEINDFVGKLGIERVYDHLLREKKGEYLIERRKDKKEPKKILKKMPRVGESILLTIDLKLQKVAKKALAKGIREVNSKAGALVIINPENGEIVAMVSLPSFDNNLFGKGITKEQLEKLNSDPLNPQLNRVIAGLYPVGSTIKPLIGLFALEEGIISGNTKFFCPKKLCLENKYTKKPECFYDWKFHGWTDIKKAIAESVNPFFYLIAGGYRKNKYSDPRIPEKVEGLGIKRIKKWLEEFNLGRKTAIDLIGEKEGRVPDPEWKKNYFKNEPLVKRNWYLGDTYNIAIGQGFILATPLQLAVSFSALLNGGNLYRPHLLKAILNEKKEIVKEIKPTLVRKIKINPKNVKLIKEGMRLAVSSPAGSAHFLNDLPEKVAVKTGTAQTGKKDSYHNWIVVFGPYQKPKFVMVILVENVKGVKIIAQKIAKEILEWYFKKEKGAEDLLQNHS